MAQQLLERACQRFRDELTSNEDHEIRATSWQDVQHAIVDIERQLAARQCLRNLDRLSPYLKAVEGYGSVVEIFCNSSTFVPYVWGPVKFILLAVKEQTQALDKLLSSYAQLGNALPRLSALREALRDNHAVQQLFAFLYEDIVEFHRRVYKLIRKPAWKLFFASAWGRFEHRFGALIDNIAKTTELIEKEATTNHILEAKQWRQHSLDDSVRREQQRESEQRQMVLNWLEAGENDQELRLEVLNKRWYDGTTSWITKNTQFRSWLQRERGKQVLWVYGKPGSGKSVLMSQIISFMRSDPQKRTLFFFCDYCTPAHDVPAQIFKAYLAQSIRRESDLAPFIYENYSSKGRSPTTKLLKEILVTILKESDFVRLIVDGVDEVQSTEHRRVLQELHAVTVAAGTSCKLLVSSQDLPTIRSFLSGRSRDHLFLGDEKQAISQDMAIVVDASLESLGEVLGVILDMSERMSLRKRVLEKAEGMFLWLRLVLSLLETAGSLEELRSTVDSLPQDLEEMYDKLLERIRNNCVAPGSDSKVRRIFGWLLFAEKRQAIRKRDVLLGSSLHEGTAVLQRSTKPFPNSLDICKPLIEDGPGGTVSLIHSTLSTFLLRPQNWPFISFSSSHHDIAFACVSQVMQTLDFASNDVPSPTLTERVGLGLLGLQEYAHEYWLTHVLRYFEASNRPVDQQSPLLIQLSRFAAKHMELLARAQHKTFPGASDSISSTIQHNIPEGLQFVPEPRTLICQVLNFRHNFDTKQASEGPDILATDWDPTLLSRANSRYNDAIKSLVFASSWVGLSPAELETFQSEYRRTAFICTVRSCERSRFGYPSVVELKDHKTREHTTGFKCYHQNCRYNDIGFTSLRSLRMHMKKSHLKDVPEVPKTLKRKYLADGSPNHMRATEAPVSVPQVPQRPPNQQPLSNGMDFGHYAFQFIQSSPYVGPGWQNSVSTTERVGKAQDLITSAVLATPNQPWQRLAQLCLQFEQNAFREAPDKVTYDHKMRQKSAEMHARRQATSYGQRGAVQQLPNRIPLGYPNTSNGQP